jgi:hypothetical protein
MKRVMSVPVDVFLTIMESQHDDNSSKDSESDSESDCDEPKKKSKSKSKAQSRKSNKSKGEASKKKSSIKSNAKITVKKVQVTLPSGMSKTVDEGDSYWDRVYNGPERRMVSNSGGEFVFYVKYQNIIDHAEPEDIGQFDFWLANR